MKTRHLHNPILFTLALLMALMVSPLQAGNYSRMVVFGDSLSDPGNAYALTGQISLRPYTAIPDAPYANGGLHFSNGSTWVEILATRMGLADSAGPAFKSPVFTNYAVGGARARPTAAMPLSAQVGIFLGQHGNSAPSDALYILFVGGNDIRDAIETFSDPEDMGASSGDIITDAVASIAENIQLLLDTGAQHVLVVNAPNLGAVPAIVSEGPLAQMLGYGLSDSFNQALAATLSSLLDDPRLQLTQFNMFDFLNLAVAAPGLFGVTNATTPCITPDVIVGAVCSNAGDYLFWDGIHPTAVGHEIIATAVENTLVQ